MMHYKKGQNIEEELTKDNIPIECLPKDFLWMHIKGGTKVSNVIDYAKKAVDNKEFRSVVWTGSGGGVAKTISCSEIFKRSYPLHQVTRICYRKVEEYWDPQMDGLEQIVACRQIPCISILQSLDEIDNKVLGYQHSDTKLAFFEDSNPRRKPQGNKEHKSNQRQGFQGKKFRNKNNKKQDGENQKQPQPTNSEKMET